MFWPPFISATHILNQQKFSSVAGKKFFVTDNDVAELIQNDKHKSNNLMVMNLAVVCCQLIHGLFSAFSIMKGLA